jgi:hypothetical protein
MHTTSPLKVNVSGLDHEGDYCSVLPPVSYHQRGIHDEDLHCVLHRRSCWWIEINWRWVTVHDGRWKSANGAKFVGLLKKGNPLPSQLVGIIIVFFYPFFSAFALIFASWSLLRPAKKQLEDLAGLWFKIVGSLFEKTITPLFLSTPLVNISTNLKRCRMYSKAGPTYLYQTPRDSWQVKLVIAWVDMSDEWYSLLRCHNNCASLSGETNTRTTRIARQSLCNISANGDRFALTS